MSVAVQPPSLTLPPAPRIGTAGSPLDQPSVTSQSSPREGLGLGGIHMPEGMQGTLQGGDSGGKFDTRYIAFKPPRSAHLRHGPSVSSPPSLVPFVKNLNIAPGASNPPAPSVTSRKFSLQPQSSGYGGHSRKASEGLISYPIVSRTDSFSTFTPDEERRPAPMPSTIINDSRGSQTPVSVSPSTSRAAEEGRSKPRRSSRSTRSPPPPLDLEFSGVSNYSVFPTRTSTTTSKARKGSNSTMTTERMENFLTAGSDPAYNRMRGLRISHTSSRPSSSQFDSSDDDEDDSLSRISSSISRRGSCAVSQMSHPSHRRAASEESPRIVQAMTFVRAKSAENVIPSELPLKGILKGAGGINSARARNIASPALIPISEVKAAKARAHAAESRSKKMAASASLPRTVSTRYLIEDPNTLDVSVKNSVETKEMGKAAIGREGVTVCLRSYTKPEDLEVSWSCVSRIDEEGRAYSQWEMKFLPRQNKAATNAPTNGANSAHYFASSLGSSSNADFLNYRMNAPSPPPSSAKSSTQPRRTHSTTSPLSQTVDPLIANAGHTTTTSIEPRRRKSSSTSTSTASRSDSFSQGTSFSSESSYGPTTPVKYVSNTGHRRRKSSISGLDFVEEREAPPLPTASYFDIPVLPTSTAHVAHDSVQSISPSRTNRSSSYNGPGTVRQFSIDQSVYIPRSASMPEAGLYHCSSVTSPTSSSPVKSPARDNRFARCLPPSRESKLDLAALTASTLASRPSPSPPPSSSSPHAFPSSTTGGSFFAARQASRKQSITVLPPSLSTVPTFSEQSVTTGMSTPTRMTSPYTSSPLGRSTDNNTTDLTSQASSSGDQNRTPTRLTHSQPTTTSPTSSPPPLSGVATTYSTLNSRSGRDSHLSCTSFTREGGTSEELLTSPSEPDFSQDTSPSPSPSFSNIGDEEGEGGDTFGTRMAKLRQTKRMMSRWSDTETEEDDEDEEGTQRRNAIGLTSWGRIPDSTSITDHED